MRLSQSFKAVVGSASCAADNGDALVVGGSAVARQAASIGRIGRNRGTDAGDEPKTNAGRQDSANRRVASKTALATSELKTPTVVSGWQSNQVESPDGVI